MSPSDRATCLTPLYITSIIALVLGATTAGAIAQADAGEPDPRLHVNLIRNPGFERPGNDDDPIAAHWLTTGEDQVADWAVASYRIVRRGDYIPPRRDPGAARTGQFGLRLGNTGPNTSSVYQRIILNQTEPNPIQFVAWSRYDAQPGIRHDTESAPRAELSIANARYTNQSKAPVDREQPLINMTRGSGDWIRSHATFVPEKPLRYIDVKIELQSSGATAMLCVDDVHVAEVDATVTQLQARGVDVPAPALIVTNPTANPPAVGLPLIDQAGQGRAANIRLRARAVETPAALVIDVESDDALPNDQLEILLAPYDRKPFDLPIAADLFRIRLDGNNVVQLDWILTRNERHLGADNDIALYLPQPAVRGLTARRESLPNHRARWRFTIPYASLGSAQPISPTTWRINLCLRRGESLLCAAPTHTLESLLGQLIFPSPAESPAPVVIERVEFLTGPFDQQSIAPFTVPGRFPWGDTPLRVRVRNCTSDPVNLTLNARIAGHVTHTLIQLTPHQINTVDIIAPLRTPGRQTLQLALSPPDAATPRAALHIPVTIAPLIRTWLFETFAYHDEDHAEIFTSNNAADPDQIAAVRLRIENWRGRPIGSSITQLQTESRTHTINLPIADVPAHPDPIADHWIITEALDRDGRVIESSRTRWGKMTRPAPRAADPIDHVTIDDRGYFSVNDKPFFAVIASLHTNDLAAGYLRTPRVGFNAAKINCGTKDMIHIGRASYKDVYTALYRQGVYAAPMCFVSDRQTRINIIDWFKTTPMYLCQLGGEIYHRPADQFDHPDWRTCPQRPVVLEYMNCGSWLDHARHGKQIAQIAMTPIFSRAQSAHRDLAAFYARERAVSPRTALMTSIVTSAGDFDIWDTRTTAYVSVIHGATGIYNYIVAPDHAGTDDRIVEIARGFATELRAMGPIFVAEDQRRTISVNPPDTGLHVAERRIDDHRYLIVANTRDAPIEATFQLDPAEAANRVDVIYEPADPISLTDDQKFTDTIPAHWARVYRIKLQ
ncbi:MAG: hypothetical protein CMJ49_14345 [Planctomycetaceae bacterium]|nr:hypothetical protein [Planctomycetaceae bacterium]